MNNNAFQELIDRIKPNTFVTLTAKQGVVLKSGVYIPPTYNAFEKAAGVLWKGIMVQLYGKRAYRRKKNRLLPNVTVFEQSDGGMWHLHACVRRPPHVTLAEFNEIVKRAWYKSAWSKRIVQVEEYRDNGVPYILKTGQDAILVSFLCLDD